MMIRCDRHGDQLGLLMSPDLAASLEEGKKAGPLAVFRFIYRDENLGRMVVSEVFSNDEKMPGERQIPLPEDFPAWYHKLVVVCEKCAAAYLPSEA